jgi:hypothetical protein
MRRPRRISPYAAWATGAAGLGGERFHHFILDHPDLQEDGRLTDADANVQQRLEDWLERETSGTDLSHKATLLQLASAYEAMVEMRDPMTTSTGL